MKPENILVFSLFIFILSSCADYKSNTKTIKKEKSYFSSTGFALIYEDNLYKQKILSRKINNENLEVIHRLLKINTPVKIFHKSNQENPALINPGDRVTFYKISKQEYRKYNE